MFATNPSPGLLTQSSITITVPKYFPYLSSFFFRLVSVSFEFGVLLSVPFEVGVLLFVSFEVGVLLIVSFEVGVLLSVSFEVGVMGKSWARPNNCLINSIPIHQYLPFTVIFKTS